MNRLFILMYVLLAAEVNGQLLFKITSDTLKTFVYSGGDEFNKPSLNTAYWKGPWTNVNMAQNFRYNDANVKLEDGLVNFVMLKKDSVYKIRPHEIDSNFIKETKITVKDYQYPLNYSAGMIISQQKFHYGLYELKFKVEEGKGVWPAFWFYGGNKNEEIDAFELKGEKNNQIHVDMHCPYGCDNGYRNKLGIKTNWGGWMPVSEYLHDGFNIMLLEWKPDEILWYVNGYPIAYFKGTMPNPMNLFLNTQIAADGRAFKPGPDKSTVFPNNFYVDYIRIWKESPLDTVPLLRAKNDIGLSQRFATHLENKPITKRGLMYARKKFNDEQGLVSVTLSENRKMTVAALGKLNASTSIVLLGKTRNYVIDKFNNESEFTLDPQEKELELVIKFDKKEFRKRFKISS